MRSVLPVIFVTFGLFTLVPASPVSAQDRPAPAVELAAGWVGFADDGIVSETLVGGSGRWYVSPRVSLGPEVVYISGDNHSHLVVTGNVMFDWFAAPRAVAPFLVVGGGMFRTSETFFGETISSSEGAFTAGGGVRAAVTDRVTVGVEARAGWETHVRINGTVGVRLGR